MCGAQVQRHQRKSDWEFEPVTRTLTNLLSWTEKTQSPEGSRSEDDKSNGHPNHSRPCIILKLIFHWSINSIRKHKKI